MGWISLNVPGHILLQLHEIELSSCGFVVGAINLKIKLRMLVVVFIIQDL